MIIYYYNKRTGSTCNYRRTESVSSQAQLIRPESLWRPWRHRPAPFPNGDKHDPSVLFTSSALNFCSVVSPSTPFVITSYPIRSFFRFVFILFPRWRHGVGDRRILCPVLDGRCWGRQALSLLAFAIARPHFDLFMRIENIEMFYLISIEYHNLTIEPNEINIF